MLPDVPGRSVAAVLERLASCPDCSVDCVVSRPVFEGVSIRDVVSGICLVWSEVSRVLRPGGTTWLVLGDARTESGSVLGLPWRIVFALQREGWLLRNALVTNAVADESCCETGFLLVKRRHYFFNGEAIRSGHGKNPGDVVQDVARLIARCVTAGCPPGGVLLDPFDSLAVDVVYRSEAAA